MTAQQPEEPQTLSHVKECPQLQPEATGLTEPVTAPADGTAVHSDAALAHNMTATAFRDDVPLVQQTALLQTLFDTRLQVLKTSHSLKRHLRQHCSICSQWIANVRSVKTHQQKTHVDISSADWALVQATCVTFAAEITNPCPFCERELALSSIQRHASNCTVLHQVILAILLQQRAGNVSRQGGEGFLWSASAGEQPGSSGHAARRGRGQGTETAKVAQECQQDSLGPPKWIVLGA